MKKWEEERLKKIHQQKIKKTKSRVNTNNTSHKSLKNSGMRASTASTGKRESYKISDIGSPVISNDVMSEENSYEISTTPVDQTLVFKLLKAFKLQQYAKKMQEFGFGIEIYKLAIMNDREKLKLIDDLKLLPGHQSRFEDMFVFLETIKSQYLSNQPGMRFKQSMENLTQYNVSNENLFIATSGPLPKR